MPARLVGARCVFPGCIAPPHGAGLCWPHFQGARPFDENDPVSVELAVERLIARLAPPPHDVSDEMLDAWPVLSDAEADRRADLLDDARASDAVELEDGQS